METCRMIHRVSPSCIPLTLLNGILNAIAPFASLLLSSFLLDALFLEKNEQKALVLAGEPAASFLYHDGAARLFRKADDNHENTPAI